MKIMRRVSHLLFTAATLSAGCAILVAAGGCDVQSANQRVHIAPDSVVIDEGQSIVFTASGGYVYEWSLDTPELGVLSTRTGNTTTYKSIYDADANGTAVQILRVTSTVTDENVTTGSNSTAYLQEAEAYITHISTESGISVTPSGVSLNVGGSQVFTASGGSSYTWSLSNESEGETVLAVLSSTSGDQVTVTYQTQPSTTRLVTLTAQSAEPSGSAVAQITLTVPALTP